MHHDPRCIDPELDAYDQFHRRVDAANVEMAYQRRSGKRVKRVSSKTDEKYWAKLSDVAHVLQRHARVLPDTFHAAFDERTTKQLVLGGSVNLQAIRQALDSHHGPEILEWYSDTVKAGM